MSGPRKLRVYYGRGEIRQAWYGVDLSAFQCGELEHPCPEAQSIRNIKNWLTRSFGMDPNMYTVSIQCLWTQNVNVPKWELREIERSKSWVGWLEGCKRRGYDCIMLVQPCRCPEDAGESSSNMQVDGNEDNELAPNSVGGDNANVGDDDDDDDEREDDIGQMAGRAKWVEEYTEGLVDVLHENNVSHYCNQHGWKPDGWRKIISDFSDRYPDAKFSKVQIQEHETQLKKEYRLIKSILQREGVFWEKNTCMIVTSDEIWDEIIKEIPKARKYQTKSFPLLKSLEVLFDGDIPEGEHDITPSKPQIVSGRADEVVNNMSVLGRAPELMADLSSEDVLERPNNGAVPKPQKPDEPAQSSSCIEPKKDKRKKRKIPDIQQTMEAYLDFRMKQGRIREQATKDGEQYSISKCIKALQAMPDVSDQVRVLASDVFKDAANREIFLSYDPRLGILWLKKEVNRLLS